ncbi:C4-dicarboxylate ABC transporter [Veronia nyctiphanis]|uniref:C4-dicarboxylate ABC transporter n=1 Tax=Veronia nyctiphanis TaxID=1278244 RepID=A0A4Q0YU50_9GAMM|nr:TDT family transporter [Veronia nyctiphanis]RXJ72541.1 C4-dicarboxylate ABC transporter [Veronia nyctiphanis]
MKNKLTLLPTPLAGLALAIASLGWSWENIAPLEGNAKLAGAAIGGILLVLLALKFITVPKTLVQDLAHPVVGSVVPTFAMGMMVVSHGIGEFNPILGDSLWLIAIAIHLIFLSLFVIHRAKDFTLSDMVPSWFVPPVGLIVADVAFSGNPALAPIANGVLMFGLLSYCVLLPMMMYRLIFCTGIPDAAKPTIAILAAPASLSLAGYLTVAEQPSPILVSVLLGIAVLMTSLVYLSFIRLLRLPFSPGYAAFTFPMVIGATALYKVAGWAAERGMETAYVEQLTMLANIELIIATCVVVYVAFRYVRFLTEQFQIHSGALLKN